MAYRSHSLKIEDALASSQETYDLDFEAWGYREEDPTKPNQNVRFPPSNPTSGSAAIPTTLAGLSIGPKSTIDRCWVTWDRQRNLTLPTDSAVDITSPPRFLSLGAPLTYAQATNPGTLADDESQAIAMQKGLLYIFAYGDLGGQGPYHTGEFGLTTILPVNYADQWGVSRTVKSTGSDFESPTLHLVLNLRAGLELFSPPTKRFPLNRSRKSSVLLAAPKTRVAMVPIYGRKNVRVQAVSRADGLIAAEICDFYVGLIRNMNESDLTGVDSQTPVCEVGVCSSLATPANGSPVEFRIDNPCADYVTLYVTTASANTSVVWTITAED